MSVASPFLTYFSLSSFKKTRRVVKNDSVFERNCGEKIFEIDFFFKIGSFCNFVYSQQNNTQVKAEEVYQIP